MEKKIVTFKGITNVPDDGLNEAGDMAVLMNMRHKGGELVPCQPPMTGDLEMGKIRQALYHANSTFWLVLDNNGVLQEWSSSLNKRLKVENVSSFSIMGNIVIVNFEDRVEYAIWKENRYIYLGSVPEVPRLIVKKLDKATQTYLTDSQLDGAPDEDTYHWRHQKGNIDKTLAMIYSRKGYVDRAWFRIGVKLFDGSYINIGEIFELSCFPNMVQRTQGEAITQKIVGAQKIWYNTATNRYVTELDYFIPDFGIVSNLGNWMDVVASIDLFSTGSIMSHTVGLLDTNDDKEAPPGIEIYKLRTAEQLKEAMLNAEFYKVAEFAADGTVITGTEVENTSPSNLAVRPTLTDISVHSVIPENAMAYNARLHTYGYKEVYFKGYSSATSYYPGLTVKDGAWTVFVHIKTDKGTVIVKREDKMYSDSVPGNAYKHLYYFYYPDRNAFKMEIYSNGKVLSLPLTAHPYRNEAYNLMTTTVNVELDEDNQEKSYSIVDLPVLVGEEWEQNGWHAAGSMPSETKIVERKDTLKVSAVDNPFYFPTAQTYKFEGEIVGLASNAEAISPGQFGLFPLHVFTDTGIWAMQVDASGKGAYTTQSPASREVCNGAICPVSGGVVFSTDKGVMVISGGQVADLSAALDGFEVDFFEENATMWEKIFEKAGKDAVVNPVPIREYIKGAVIAYNYHYNEIIVSNNKKGYSYVYSLTNKAWSVIDVVFDLTTNKYPELVVFDKGAGKMYTFKDGAAQNKVVAITRPFTFGSIDFKRIRQAGLRTTFEGQLNFYVLGSVDGANFVCITGKEAAEVKGESGEVKTRRDLITAMSRSKQYKYFAIAIVGNIKGRVSMAELLVDMGFANNKIR